MRISNLSIVGLHPKICGSKHGTQIIDGLLYYPVVKLDLQVSNSSSIPPLNDDCAMLVLSMLDRTSLHAVANTSRRACASARRLLVQEVTLRSFDHAATFCEVVLADDLAHLVRRLIIEKPVPFVYHRKPGVLEKFASNLASVLDKVYILDTFALESFAGTLLITDLRIAVALLARRPRRLSLNGADGLSLGMISSITGLEDLSLVVQDNFEGCPSILSSVIESSANTLRSLVLKAPVPDFLTSPDVTLPICPAVHTVVLYANRDMDLATLKRLSQAFPALRRLAAAAGSFAIHSSDILDEFRTLPFNALTAVSGDVALIAFLALFHALCNINVVDIIVSPAEEWHESLERLAHCPIRGAKLSMHYWHTDSHQEMMAEIGNALRNIEFLAVSIHYPTVADVRGALGHVSSAS